MSKDDKQCTHSRESTLNALQVAVEVHDACPACSGTAALYLAALAAMYDLEECREGFLRMAAQVWDDTAEQAEMRPGSGHSSMAGSGLN